MALVDTSAFRAIEGFWLTGLGEDAHRTACWDPLARRPAYTLIKDPRNSVHYFLCQHSFDHKEIREP